MAFSIGETLLEILSCFAAFRDTACFDASLIATVFGSLRLCAVPAAILLTIAFCVRGRTSREQFLVSVAGAIVSLYLGISLALIGMFSVFVMLSWHSGHTQAQMWEVRGLLMAWVMELLMAWGCVLAFASIARAVSVCVQYVSGSKGPNNREDSLHRHAERR